MLTYEEYMAKHPNVASQSDDEKNAAYQLYKANWKEKTTDALLEVPETAQVDYDEMYSAMADMYEKISTMNEEKFNRYWPESQKEGIAAGQVYDEASRGQADAMNNWLTEMSKDFNINMRGEAAESNKWIMGQVSDVNKFNADEFYGAMEAAMPGMRGTASDYKKTVDQMLSGQLPDVVKSEMAQAGAERGLSSGIYGPSLENAQLRDLGIERLRYLQAGQAQMPALMGLTQAMTAPVATPNIYQNVMMTPTPYAPSPASIPGIAGNYLASIMGQTMMQPAAGVQSATQMGGVSAGINQSNTQMQYAKAQSMMNYGMYQDNMAWNQEMFKQQQNAAQSQNWWGLAGAGMQALGVAGGGLLGGL